MNIELYEGQVGNLYIALNGEFEVYGGTTKSQFTVTKTGDVYHVTIPGQVRTSCYDPRFDIFARRASTGQEWLVTSGRINLNTRHSAEPTEAISPVEYRLVVELLERGETATGEIIAGIKGERGERGEQGEQGIQGERGEQGAPGVRGERGYSAYELMQQHGYTGTEAQFTDMLATFEAAAQKAVDAQILAEVNAINALEAAQEARAILEEIKGVTE